MGVRGHRAGTGLPLGGGHYLHPSIRQLGHAAFMPDVCARRVTAAPHRPLARCRSDGVLYPVEFDSVFFEHFSQLSTVIQRIEPDAHSSG